MDQTLILMGSEGQRWVLSPTSATRQNQEGAQLRRTARGLPVGLLWQTFQGPVPFLDAFRATGESQGVRLDTQSIFLLLSLVPQEHEPGGWGRRGSWWQGTQGLAAEWWGACSRSPGVQSPLPLSRGDSSTQQGPQSLVALKTTDHPSSAQKSGRFA